MKKIITSILAIASLFSGKSMAMENTDQIVSKQEIEIIENEKKYENYVVSENDEENLIKEISSELTENFSNIELCSKENLIKELSSQLFHAIGLSGDSFIDLCYNSLCNSYVGVNEVKKQCKNLNEVKEYLLRKLFNLACEFYISRPDMMASHATEEDYRNYHIVKKWTDEGNLDNIFNKILSRIDVENLEFDDLTQACKSIGLILIN